jgi:predicted aconitase with swiveling domain
VSDAELILTAPLSFWGGIDPETGKIIDVHHPQLGAIIAGKVLVMPSGRGSSSSSTVLAEALRLGKGPAAIVLDQPDPIIWLGAYVAELLYGVVCPVTVAKPPSG